MDRNRDETINLSRDWAVIGVDDDYQEYYMPFETGKYLATEEEARQRARELRGGKPRNCASETQGKFRAEKYTANSRIDFGTLDLVETESEPA